MKRTRSRPIVLACPPDASATEHSKITSDTCQGMRSVPWALSVSLIALGLAVVVSSSGCALAARAGIGGMAMRGVAAGAMRAGAVRGVAGAVATSRMGALAADVGAVRGATAALLRPSLVARTGGAQVVSRGGGILGQVEVLGPQRLLVRSAESQVVVHATRVGSQISYRAIGRNVGHSELRGGAVHHYVYDTGGTRYLGYDVVRGGRVFQYDPSGILLAETTLAGSLAGATFPAAALAVAVGASVEAEREVDKKVDALMQAIDRFKAGNRR